MFKTHFSPAAADGKEPKRSGCFGRGDSLEREKSQKKECNFVGVTCVKYGCCMASSAVIRRSGSYVSKDIRRSIPALERN